MEVEITLKNYRCFSDQHPVRLTWRPGFTAFVGPNNSGKSSLLRFFFEFRWLLRALSEVGGVPHGALVGDPQPFSSGPWLPDPHELLCNSNNRALVVQFRFDSLTVEQASEYGVPEGLDVVVRRDKCAWTVHPVVKGRHVELMGQRRQPGDLDIIGTDQGEVNLAPLWEAFKVLSRPHYVGPFRNALNVATDQEYFDIAVGLPFIKRWREWKTGNVKQQNLVARRVEEDIRRIFDVPRLEINASHDEQTLQLTVNDKPYRLAEVGSGLAQFIIVLANAAMKQPAYILIDEPELNLHPRLQLDFLTTLASYATEGTVLFATHSIGLARAAADRILTFRVADDGSVHVVDLERTPRLSELLGELSFSGYQELGFKKVLLVEGATEVRAIQQLLRLYRKDHEIVLLPLGGSGMIKPDSEPELEEIKRITTGVHALIDSERTAPDKPLSGNIEGFVESCKRAGINCHVLERRALENYFPDQAVKKVKGAKHRALGPYEALKEISPPWGKAENWRIAREMTREDLEGTDLGQFLSGL